MIVFFFFFANLNWSHFYVNKLFVDAIEKLFCAPVDPAKGNFEHSYRVIVRL